MRRLSQVLLALMVLAGIGASPAAAWNFSGRVVCDTGAVSGAFDDLDQPLAGVVVNVTGSSISNPSFIASAITTSTGGFFISLPDTDGTYTASITLPSGASYVSPVGGTHSFATDPVNHSAERDWVLNAAGCQPARCWLTGGGAKFNPIANGPVAEHGPQHSFGGNVYPGCSPDSGDGGNWNHIAHQRKLHFQGTDIQILRCGNVDGIPPGSTSPATPFNFIEFQGTGRLKGIKGNQVDYGTVSFFARAEDRNEPGSNGQNDGAGKDRYLLHVYQGSTTLLLLDLDASAATTDPVTITDGNMQIHISSCDDPPPQP